MREDECQIIRGAGAENLGVCRHIEMNLLTADTSFKAGIKQKQIEQEGIMNTYRKSLRAAGLHDFALNNGAMIQNCGYLAELKYSPTRKGKSAPFTIYFLY